MHRLLALAGLLVVACEARRPHPALAWLGRDDRQVLALAQAGEETGVRAHLQLAKPAHVYLALFSPSEGILALFPCAQLRDAPVNPLPAGQHHLPGHFAGKPLHWPVPARAGAVSLLAVVAHERQPELESALARCRQLGNAAFPNRAFGIAAPPATLDPVPRGELPHPLLRAAAAAADGAGALEPAAGHPDVWVGALRLLAH
ncbi:MAG: hypothetical protein IT458_17030 [Planctomycetes bacterium]|nr:hypothetical protein [Planctomycetota bacterium]